MRYINDFLVFNQKKEFISVIYISSLFALRASGRMTHFFAIFKMIFTFFLWFKTKKRKKSLLGTQGIMLCVICKIISTLVYQYFVVEFQQANNLIFDAY
jgi:hypothetical protein